MIASLPMYDRPELRPPMTGCGRRSARGWAKGRPADPRAAPSGITGAIPDLVLSQTCGYPFRAHLHGTSRWWARPITGSRAARLAITAASSSPAPTIRATPRRRSRGRAWPTTRPLSQSGWAAPQNFARDQGFAFAPRCARGPCRLGPGGGRGARRHRRARRAELADDAALRCLFAALAEVGPHPAHPRAALHHRAGPRPGTGLRRAGGGDRRSGGQDRAALSLRGVVRIPAEAYLASPTPAAGRCIARRSG